MSLDDSPRKKQDLGKYIDIKLCISASEGRKEGLINYDYKRWEIFHSGNILYIFMMSTLGCNLLIYLKTVIYREALFVLTKFS